MNISCPCCYDQILRHIYGNYMTLPPENRRKPKHSVYYCNLSQKISKEAILRQNNKVSPPIKLSTLIKEFKHRKSY